MVTNTHAHTHVYTCTHLLKREESIESSFSLTSSRISGDCLNLIIGASS